MKTKQPIPISFHFHPTGFDDGAHIVEKADGTGQKRRYLKGISSGVRQDGHGERMTDNCIKSFTDQASSGDVLLFPDVHGVRGTDDIGILTNHSIDSTGDWNTEYRLYDETDPAEPYQIQRANVLWKQVNGLPPYTKPRQKGFSIEGYVPPEGILEQSEDGRRVLDNIDLDGVVVVPRPAYKDSIAHAVFKALGEVPPWQIEKSITGKIQNKIAEEEMRDGYYKKQWQIREALEEEIKEVMALNPVNAAQLLDILFDEYKSVMINLILQSSSLFEPDPDIVLSSSLPIAKANEKSKVFKSLSTSMRDLQKLINLRSK